MGEMNKFVVVLFLLLLILQSIYLENLEQQKTAQGSDYLKTIVTANTNDDERKKRFLGLVASLFNRMMFNEVQDTMVNYTEEDNLLKLVNCEPVMEKKSCIIRENETVCKSYFQSQCFLFTYPRTTVTIVKH